LYLQLVSDEQIVAFEPLEESLAGPIVPLDNRGSPAVTAGDMAVYVYAFGPADAIAGNRSVVSRAIEQRFDEIAPKVFAACTAAQFAHLKSRLPDLNRRAFRLLTTLDATSARQWRDSSVFLAALRDELRGLEIPPNSVHVRSQDRREQLEVILTLRLDYRRNLPQKQIENTCKNLLIGSGLFGKNDLFTLRLESAGEPGSPCPTSPSSPLNSPPCTRRRCCRAADDSALAKW
jgi:hypothetical protein